MTNKDKEEFRAWMLKTYGRQDANDFAGTFTEEIAIRYAQHKQTGIKTEGSAVCGDCGKQLTLVRPGKHQCDNVNCISILKFIRSIERGKNLKLIPDELSNEE